jgi:hypothetical protein
MVILIKESNDSNYEKIAKTNPEKFAEIVAEFAQDMDWGDYVDDGLETYDEMWANFVDKTYQALFNCPESIKDLIDDYGESDDPEALEIADLIDRYYINKNESVRRNRSIKEYIDNSEDIYDLEGCFDELKRMERSKKNMTKEQYNLFTAAYNAISNWRYSNGSEKDVFHSCYKFAEYCKNNPGRLTIQQMQLVDYIHERT